MDVGQAVVKAIYKKRQPDSHKGDFGSVLVIGGSDIYSGSPAFVAMAALRSGADLARIAAPMRSADIAASFSPDLITYPLKGPCLSASHFPILRKLLEKSDAVAIGNGLGVQPVTRSAVMTLLSRIEKPCVVDADAIKALDGRRLGKNFVLTPHAVELRSLCRGTAETVKSVAKRLGCVVLLKGHADVISDGDSVAINRTGNSFMTKGGTGDTLAGICAAMLARGASPFKAACAAAYVNGLAGDIAAKRLGESMLASDVLNAIPEALRRVL